MWTTCFTSCHTYPQAQQQERYFYGMKKRKSPLTMTFLPRPEGTSLFHSKPPPWGIIIVADEEK